MRIEGIAIFLSKKSKEKEKKRKDSNPFIHYKQRSWQKEKSNVS
jgi:hypothetical protein